MKFIHRWKPHRTRCIKREKVSLRWRIKRQETAVWTGRMEHPALVSCKHSRFLHAFNAFKPRALKSSVKRACEWWKLTVCSLLRQLNNRPWIFDWQFHGPTKDQPPRLTGCQADRPAPHNQPCVMKRKPSPRFAPCDSARICRTCTMPYDSLTLESSFPRLLRSPADARLLHFISLLINVSVRMKAREGKFM